MKILSRDLGVDLGTANILVYADGKGIVLREPSVVALDKNTGKILQVGAAARNMLFGPVRRGQCGSDAAYRWGGVISDCRADRSGCWRSCSGRRRAPWPSFKPRVIVVSVPSGITEVEERAVIQAAPWRPAPAGST